MVRRRGRRTPAEAPEGGGPASGDPTPTAPTAPVTRSEFDLGGSPARGQARLSELGESLGKAWGKTVALPLSVAPVARKMMLPFGVLLLDWRSKGGMVVGGVNRLWGKKSTFKSTLCLRALRSAQQHCRHCVTGDTLVQGRVRSVQRMRYSGEIVKVTTESGRTLSLTPGHRVVAAHAFVKAGELEEGQYLLRHVGESRMPALPTDVQEHGEYHEPTAIEEIFRSFAERGGSTTHRVGADDFDGDARFGDGEVQVVSTDGVLSFGADAEDRQGIGESVFVVDPSVASTFELPQVVRSGRLDDFSVGASSPADRGPSLPALSLDVRGVAGAATAFRPLELSCFGAASQLDAPFLEPETYDMVCHAEFTRELLDRGAGKVAPDKIVHIERNAFTGHVYDLQTETGWMVASDVFISNCKFPLVRSPEDGTIDCRCPKPRYWLNDPADYVWLPNTAAIDASYGRLPDGTVMRSVAGLGRVPCLRCAPPPHIPRAKARDIPFTETYRNEPFRCLYCDSEGTIDASWAEANGVDTNNVQLIGAEWAEQNLASIEESILTREYDLIIIDSTSMLETKSNMEKTIMENTKVADKARILGRFMKRFVSASAQDGLLARYRPTVLCTSQVTTKGIGGGPKAHAYLDATDGNTFEHGLSLDVKMFEAGYTFDEARKEATVGSFGFEIRKSKVGASVGATGEVKFWLKGTPEHAVGDSNDLETVMSYARRFGDGFIEEGQGATKLTLRTSFVRAQKVEFARVGDCETYLRTNTTIYDDLRQRVLAKLMADGIALEVPRSQLPATQAEAAVDL